MNLAKKALMFLTLVMLAAILVSILAPKATHALVATLVQVSNTPSSPVPNKDVDNPDRATVVDLSCVASALPSSTTAECDTTSSFSVPAGQRLILEEFEAGCTTPEGNAIFGVAMNFSQAGNGSEHVFALSSSGNHPGYTASGYSQVTSYVTNQRIRYYIDAGSPIYFEANTTDTSGSTNCTFQASGHLVSYP